MKEGARMVVVGKGVCVFAGLCGAHAQRQPGVPIQEAAPAISLLFARSALIPFQASSKPKQSRRRQSSFSATR